MTAASRPSPTRVRDESPLVGAVSLYGAYQYACILDTAGTAWCWGTKVGGVSFVAEAVPFTSTQVPYSDINELTVTGQDPTSGLRYLTAGGQYVSGNQVVRRSASNLRSPRSLSLPLRSVRAGSPRGARLERRQSP